MVKTILFIFSLVILVSCDIHQSTQNESVDVKIDSISKHQRYTTMPFYYYEYHTKMGVIPSNELKYKTGDEIKVKVIKR